MGFRRTTGNDEQKAAMASWTRLSQWTGLMQKKIGGDRIFFTVAALTNEARNMEDRIRGFEVA